MVRLLAFLLVLVPEVLWPGQATMVIRRIVATTSTTSSTTTTTTTTGGTTTTGPPSVPLYIDLFERTGPSLGTDWTNATTMGGVSTIGIEYDDYLGVSDVPYDTGTPPDTTKNYVYWNTAMPDYNSYVCMQTSGNYDGPGDDCACIIVEPKYMCCCVGGGADTWSHLGVKTARSFDGTSMVTHYTSSDTNVQFGDYIGIHRTGPETFECWQKWYNATPPSNTWVQFGGTFTRSGIAMGPGKPGAYVQSNDWINDTWEAGSGMLPFDHYCGYLEGTITSAKDNFERSSPTGWTQADIVRPSSGITILGTSDIDGSNEGKSAIEYWSAGQLQTNNVAVCLGLSTAGTIDEINSYVGPALIGAMGLDLVACLAKDSQLILRSYARGVPTDVVAASYVPPVGSYLGLRRTDDTHFQCYTSLDGISWTAQGTSTAISNIPIDLAPGFWIYGKADYKIEQWGANTGGFPTDGLPCGATGVTTTTTSSTTTSTTLAGGTAMPDWTSLTVGAWMLDEASGNRVNAQGTSGRDLVPTGGTVANSTTRFMQGTASSRSNLTATLQTSNSALLTFPYTCTMWVRPASAPMTQVIFARRDNTGTIGAGGILNITTGGQFEYDEADGTSPSDGLATPSVPFAAWSHVAVFHDSVGCGVILNGTLATSFNPLFACKPTAAPAGTGGVLRLGGEAFMGSGWAAGHQPMEGYVDELACFNIALTAPEACRVCSCGVDGSLCSCIGSTYASIGRNATACGSCTLPTDCSQPAPGVFAPPSWVPSTLAAWMLDETSGTRVNLTGTTSMDLSNIDGSDPGSSTDHQEGTRSMSIVAAQARHTNFTFPSLSSPISMGCWVKQTANPSSDAAIIMHYWGTSPGAARIDRTPSGGFKFSAYDSGSAVHLATSATGISNSVWHHVVGSMASGGTVKLYLDGALAQSVTMGTAATISQPVYVGDNFTFTGLIDECWIANLQLSAAAVCRVCSCGIRGEQCMCNGASYGSTGRNASACGSCTLPTNCAATTPP